MLSSINIMDGAIIVIAANSKLDMKPQLIQHLAAAKVGKLSKIIICLNKIDLITKEELLERKEELDELLLKYNIVPFTIIPTSFTKNVGVDYLKKAIMLLFDPKDYLERNDKAIFKISRSFDINKPGVDWFNIEGGVIGGSLVSGKLSVGDEIEIKPGYKNMSLITKILSIQTDNDKLENVIPGGLIGIKTDLDPFYCKNDLLIGNIVGIKGTLPENVTKISIKYNFVRLFGFEWIPMKNDIVTLQIGTRNLEAKLIDLEKNIFELSKSCCILENDHIIICRNIGNILRIVAEGNIN
jgi:translation initiation factor 2 subunit 3